MSKDQADAFLSSSVPTDAGVSAAVVAKALEVVKGADGSKPATGGAWRRSYSGN